jgi:hypothetical protein
VAGAENVIAGTDRGFGGRGQLPLTSMQYLGDITIA